MLHHEFRRHNFDLAAHEWRQPFQRERAKKFGLVLRPEFGAGLIHCLYDLRIGPLGMPSHLFGELVPAAENARTERQQIEQLFLLSLPVKQKPGAQNGVGAPTSARSLAEPWLQVM
jgi:hypothetical protein